MLMLWYMYIILVQTLAEVCTLLGAPKIEIIHSKFHKYALNFWAILTTNRQTKRHMESKILLPSTSLADVDLMNLLLNV